MFKEIDFTFAYETDIDRSLRFLYLKSTRRMISVQYFDRNKDDWFTLYVEKFPFLRKNFKGYDSLRMIHVG